GSEDKVEGITAPQVRATVFGPAGPQQLAMALDSAGGKRIIAAKEDGSGFASVVDAGGYALAWWQGASGTWLVAGHSGAESGLLTAVLDWTAANETLSTPNLPAASQANLSVEGKNSDVRALLGVDGTDTLFVGTFQYPGYMGALFRGSLSSGDFDDRVPIASSDEAHPLASIQDLAYCPAAGSASSVADTLFVATGYLGLVQGGLYAVRNATTGEAPVATPLTALPFADRAVTDVVVDCQTGALTVGAASDPGVFHSSDGGASFDEVRFPDDDDGIPGEDSFQAAAIAANPENPDHIVVVANENDDSFGAGFLFETLDGGETWEALLDPSAVDDLGNQTGENLLVNDLALPPPPALEEQAAAPAKAKHLAARRSSAAPITISGVTLAPLALGTQAGGAALTLDVGARRTTPGAAQATGASGGNARIRVQWQAPADPGSRPITGYRAQCAANGKPTRTATTSSAARQADVTSLARGTRYTCNVRALSVLGAGAASANVLATTFDLPDAPRNLVGAAQSKAARLTFRAPASTGGSPITKYKATCSAPGKPSRSLERNGTTLTVTGLVSKARYRCSVQASNALGYGPASAAVNVVPK
ncbi:MAG: fibronectin type III domain-containing protein, partial [Gammaproteobacteria bacterium]|nr:fibronectin type III domain-containing protein [Gammaproteobacteria bacterium]